LENFYFVTTLHGMTRATRSPLKDKPLRVPGQSVSTERERLLDEAVGQPLTFALFFIIIAGLEWWRLYMDMKPNPIVFSSFALLCVLYAAYRVRRALPKLRNLRQALDGERAVGQFLEHLRERGFQVFHDVVGTGFNVDHVIVGTAGVFTIETKTWSKPLSGTAEISFDGQNLDVAGHVPDRDPIVQAKAQSRWLREVLRESTGREVPVRAVVVFPGWFVNSGPEAHREVWVLEPKALPGFLDKEPDRLTREDVKLTSFHLSRLIRSTEIK
jgi:hypothetical protein